MLLFLISKIRKGNKERQKITDTAGWEKLELEGKNKRNENENYYSTCFGDWTRSGTFFIIMLLTLGLLDW